MNGCRKTANSDHVRNQYVRNQYVRNQFVRNRYVRNQYVRNQNIAQTGKPQCSLRRRQCGWAATRRVKEFFLLWCQPGV
jgi:hypothetical protein